MSNDSSPSWLWVRDSPGMSKLRFRNFRGKSDYPLMVAVTTGMRESDRQDYVISVEDLVNDFEHTEGFDSRKDA
ncbi:MAG: hypothetical protein JSW72_03515, partial [Candidatus Bathyarchaeota archaeon]